MSLELLSAIVLFAGLAAYAVFGGADFGAGFWMAFAFGRNREKQREAMFDAMGPVWETNHVWLILVLVVLWTAFPSVFGAIFTGLYLPLVVALLGIVFRGAAFAFRHYGTSHENELPATGLVFSIASIATPFAMGVAVGAVAGGHLDPNVRETGIFDTWLRPFPIVCGFIALGITSFLTPAYMLLRPVGDLRDDFRRSALAGSVFLGAATTIAIPVAMWDATAFSDRLDEPRATRGYRYCCTAWTRVLVRAGEPPRQAGARSGGCDGGCRAGGVGRDSVPLPHLAGPAHRGCRRGPRDAGGVPHRPADWQLDSGAIAAVPVPALRDCRPGRGA